MSDLLAHTNVASIIEGHLKDAPAIISGGEITTYGALERQVGAVRGGLIELGLQPGDRVAIVMASNWYFVVAYLAVVGAGAVAIPLNPQAPPAELDGELAAVRPRFAFVGPTAQQSFGTLNRTNLGIAKVICPEGVSLPNAVAFEDLLLHPTATTVPRKPDDLAVMMFTSGTAGAPKAAMLSHGNLVANISAMQQTSTRMLASDVAFGVLPLFHIFGLNALLGACLSVGASLVLVQRFDPVSALSTIRDRKITVLAGVPPMFDAWLGLPNDAATAADFATIRMAVSGAARLEPKLAAAFGQRFGVRIGQGYGLTEASPTVTTSSLVDPRPETIGVPLPRLRVRLVDTDGSDVVPGDPGEIWVQGPSVFLGYLDDPEATAVALTSDGWLRTGDIAVIDDAGALTLVDRSKDLIIVSGFNVFPAEVEQVLATHPGIERAVVIGAPHPHSGETVTAVVVAKADRRLDEDEVIEHCAHSLARYKCPTKVRFVAEIPLTVGGKVRRRELQV